MKIPPLCLTDGLEAPKPIVGQVLQVLDKSATEELLELRQRPPIATIVLPDPSRDAQCRLNKLSAEDGVMAFLDIFEWTMDQEGWFKRDWANALAPLLSGDAQLAYYVCA